MTQRNPMNDRYQGDAPKGQTKRSASSLKPKTKAASSVYVRSNEKTPQEKRAIRREQRQKQRELDSMYYNPPTEEYRRLRRLWWAFLIVAIILTCAALVVPNMFPDDSSVTWTLMVPAYACILVALWLDFSKIRKVRRAYQLEMIRKHPKEAKKHSATHASNVQAEKKEAEREAKKQNGIAARIKGIFSMKEKKTSEAEIGTASTTSTASEDQSAAGSSDADDARKPIAQLKAEREAAKKAAQQSRHTETIEAAKE